MTTDIVIVAAARTAVGKFGGTLAKVPAAELGATVGRYQASLGALGGDVAALNGQAKALARWADDMTAHAPA